MKKCKEIVGRILEKKEQLAVYFCEDSRNLKLEKLLEHLLSFIIEFNKAREVMHLHVKIIKGVSMYCYDVVYSCLQAC